MVQAPCAFVTTWSNRGYFVFGKSKTRLIAGGLMAAAPALRLRSWPASLLRGYADVTGLGVPFLPRLIYQE